LILALSDAGGGGVVPGWVCTVYLHVCICLRVEIYCNFTYSVQTSVYIHLQLRKVRNINQEDTASASLGDPRNLGNVFESPELAGVAVAGHRRMSIEVWRTRLALLTSLTGLTGTIW
jgi:hypothetical protein